MNASHEDYIIRTEVLASTNDGEFHVELFPLKEDLKCTGAPTKVIHNFDELIEFLEEVEKK